MVLQDFQETGRHHEGDRQKLRRFICCISVHHALVASTALIDAKRDIRTLLFDKDADIRSSVKNRVTVVQFLPADALKHIKDQLPIIRLVGACHLTGDDDVIVFQENLDRHTAILVVLQNIRHNRIGNLIRQLVRMATGNLFTSDDFHVLFLSAGASRL